MPPARNSLRIVVAPMLEVESPCAWDSARKPGRAMVGRSGGGNCCVRCARMRAISDCTYTSRSLPLRLCWSRVWDGVADSVARGSRRLDARFRAGPARTAAVIASRPTSMNAPKATLKLPLRSNRTPMSGGPKADAGAEMTDTTPWAVPGPKAHFFPMRPAWSNTAAYGSVVPQASKVIPQAERSGTC